MLVLAPGLRHRTNAQSSRLPCVRSVASWLYPKVLVVARSDATKVPEPQLLRGDEQRDDARTETRSIEIENAGHACWVVGEDDGCRRGEVGPGCRRVVGERRLALQWTVAVTADSWRAQKRGFAASPGT